MSELVEDVKRTPMKHRQKIMLVGLGLIILCSGFVLGASVTFNYLKDRLRPPAPPIRVQMDRWAEAYGWNNQQKEKIIPILEAYHQSLIKTWGKSADEMAVARDRLVEQMKGVLTPEQFERWYSDLKQHEERRRRRMPPEFRRDRGRGGRDRGREWDRSRGERPPWRDFNRMPDANELSRRQEAGISVPESNDMP